MDSLTGRVQLLTRSPFWAILPDRLPLLVTLMLNAEGPITQGWECSKPQMHGKGNNKLAHIPVQGVLTQDGPAWLGTNYDSIGDAVEKAASDPSVKRIVLAVNSPGGEVTGLPETAAIIAQAAKVKPVSAIVEGMAASAAYWLTSQASDVTITPSGEVGSVGVRMAHVDVSKAMEDAGYKITELYAGTFKTEWTPFQPLSDAAKEDMQGRLNVVHQDFINAVAEGRGTRATADTKADRFGEGRMFTAKDAMGKGLVDTIQTPREFYRAIIPAQEQEASAPAFPVPNRRAQVEMERKRY